MTRRDTILDRQEAIRLGIIREESVQHWTEIETARYQPRRTRGSFRGRELG
jgi:hypothetical protein